METLMFPSSPTAVWAFEENTVGRHIMSDCVLEPHENDILLGRGGKNNQHTGNEKLRELARMQCDTYRRSSKKGKSYISRELVKQVRTMDPPGRFLKKDPVTGYWEDVGDDIAREKASQALRDAVSATLSSQMGGSSISSSKGDFGKMERDVDMIDPYEYEYRRQRATTQRSASMPPQGSPIPSRHAQRSRSTSAPNCTFNEVYLVTPEPPPQPTTTTTTNDYLEPYDYKIPESTLSAAFSPPAPTILFPADSIPRPSHHRAHSLATSHGEEGSSTMIDDVDMTDFDLFDGDLLESPTL